MYILKTIIDKYCKTKVTRMYACFVDFQNLKDFDRVVRTGTLFKLLRNGVETNFYKTIKSMYSSNKSCVRLEHKITDFSNENGYKTRRQSWS